MKANHTFGVLFILVSALILFSPAQYSVCAAFEDVAEEPSSEQSPSEVDSSDSQPVDQEPSVEAADNTENGNNSESEESSGLDDMSSAPSGGFQIDASETNLPSSTPDFSILTKSLIAKGRNSAILEAKVSGLFVIRAASGQGTAIRIIDRVFGTVMESGKPGKRDGECILFLDKGSYKIEMMSHNQGSGALKLLVRNCSEQNGSIPVAFNPEQTIMTDLSPFQQRSYWFSIRTNTRVKIIARGRNIADLRLWHEGQWLMDMEPDKKDDTGADSDQPIRSFAFNTELKPGFYRVTAYSVKKCEWAKKSSLDPFIISYGIRTIP